MKKQDFFGYSTFIIAIISVTVLLTNNTTQLIQTYGINLSITQVNIIASIALVTSVWYLALLK